jgi:hypothetical protein
MEISESEGDAASSFPDDDDAAAAADDDGTNEDSDGDNNNDDSWDSDSENNNDDSWDSDSENNGDDRYGDNHGNDSDGSDGDNNGDDSCDDVAYPSDSSDDGDDRHMQSEEEQLEEKEEEVADFAAEEWGKEHPLYGIYKGGRGGIWSAAETDYLARYVIKNPNGVPTTCLEYIRQDINARPIFHECHVVDRYGLRAGWRKVKEDPHRFLL